MIQTTEITALAERTNIVIDRILEGGGASHVLMTQLSDVSMKATALAHVMLRYRNEQPEGGVSVAPNMWLTNELDAWRDRLIREMDAKSRPIEPGRRIAFMGVGAHIPPLITAIDALAATLHIMQAYAKANPIEIPEQRIVSPRESGLRISGEE